MASSTIASRVIGDEELLNACATIYAAAIAVPQADRMDVFAVATRALVQTGALDPSAQRSAEGAHINEEQT